MFANVLTVVLEVVKAMAIVAIPIIAKRVDEYLVVKAEEARTNQKNAAFDATYNKLMDIIRTAVVTTNQTFVDALKATDSFDKTAYKTAYDKTYKAVMAQLDNDMKDFIRVAYGNLDVFLKNQIEYYVRVQE